MLSLLNKLTSVDSTVKDDRYLSSSLVNVDVNSDDLYRSDLNRHPDIERESPKQRIAAITHEAAELCSPVTHRRL